MSDIKTTPAPALVAASGAPLTPAVVPLTAPLAARPALAHPGVLPGTAVTAPGVELAGVPETPVSVAGVASAGPAVPSTDHYITEASPNQDTSATGPGVEGANKVQGAP